MSHHNLVNKFIPMPPAMKIPVAKAAVDQEWKTAGDNSSMEFGEKSQEQGGGCKHDERKRKSTLPH